MRDRLLTAARDLVTAADCCDGLQRDDPHTCPCEGPDGATCHDARHAARADLTVLIAEEIAAARGRTATPQARKAFGPMAVAMVTAHHNNDADSITQLIGWSTTADLCGLAGALSGYLRATLEMLAASQGVPTDVILARLGAGAALIAEDIDHA